MCTRETGPKKLSPKGIDSMKNFVQVESSPRGTVSKSDQVQEKLYTKELSTRGTVFKRTGSKRNRVQNELSPEETLSHMN